MRTGIAALLLGLAAMSSPSVAQFGDTSFDQQFASRFSPHEPERLRQPPIQRHYGKSQYKNLSFYKPKRVDGAAPLIVVVSDWQLPGIDRSLAMSRFWQELIDSGYALAFVSLEPAERHGMRASTAQLGEAITAISADPKLYGATGPIVLFGIGTGAGFVALAGCDPAILGDAIQARIRAVALVNADALDGEAAVREASAATRKTFVRSFGENGADQRRASAIGHVGAPNAPAFYFLDEDRKDVRVKSADFASALRSEGTAVVTDAMPEQTANVIAASFGNPRNPSSTALRAFIDGAVH